MSPSRELLLRVCPPGLPPRSLPEAATRSIGRYETSTYVLPVGLSRGPSTEASQASAVDPVLRRHRHQPWTHRGPSTEASQASAVDPVLRRHRPQPWTQYWGVTGLSRGPSTEASQASAVDPVLGRHRHQPWTQY
ncbi:hypothetical protein NDU88_008111 [Pleurodeles waltl]|uniref:Uncharacterized protein n=1 Tax=Pleurodeles waltl TaxID=8319 RepID=A0AAV7U4C6_PLEWA|nr:hypothetical protein NDU88_008111 [Pleurodeles waltl]